MNLPYTRTNTAAGYSDGTNQAIWQNHWTVEQVAPTTAGHFRLKFTVVTDSFSQWPLTYAWNCTDSLYYNGVTITVHASTRVSASYGYIAYVDVPDGWAGKSVQFRIADLKQSGYFWDTLDVTLVTASEITVSNGNFGSAIPISLTPSSSGVRHTVTVSCGELTTTLLDNSLATLVNWTPEIATYAGYFPNAGSAAAAITCYTYFDGALVGYTTKTITVSFAPGTVAPAVVSGWVSVAPYNTGAVSGLSGYIQGYSKARATFDPTKISPQYGATITGYSITCNGVTATGNPCDSPVLTGASASVVCKVTDSRGQTATETFAVSIEAYAIPTLSAISAYRSDSGGTADEDGSYVSLKATATISSLDGQNTVTMKGYLRLNGGSWNAGTSMTSNTLLTLSGLSPDATYEIKIELTDALGNTATATRTIPSQKWAMKFRADGQGVAFGKAPEVGNALELPAGWSILIDGEDPFSRYRWRYLDGTTGTGSISLTDYQDCDEFYVKVYYSGYVKGFSLPALCFESADRTVAVDCTQFGFTFAVRFWEWGVRLYSFTFSGADVAAGVEISVYGRG